MAFNIEIWDIGLWSAISSIMLLIVSEMISPYYSKNNIILRAKRIRHIGIGLGILFIVIAIIRIRLML